MPTRQTRRSYGAIRKLPSGRWQASHMGPDGRRHPAPFTFDTKGDADGWLATQRTDISRGDWQRPAPSRRVPTLDDYAESWLGARDLTGRTRRSTGSYSRGHILPTFGGTALDDITPADVREWHADLAKLTGATRRAHACGLLKAILATAVTDDLIDANPCRIRGASKAKRVRQIKPATLAELRAIADAMPARWRLAVSWPRGAGCDSGRSPNYADKTSTSTTGPAAGAPGGDLLDGRATPGPAENGGRACGRGYPAAPTRGVNAPPRTHPARPWTGSPFYRRQGGHLRTGSSHARRFHAARGRRPPRPTVPRPTTYRGDVGGGGGGDGRRVDGQYRVHDPRDGHAVPARDLDRDRAIASALSGVPRRGRGSPPPGGRSTRASRTRGVLGTGRFPVPLLRGVNGGPNGRPATHATTGRRGVPAWGGTRAGRPLRRTGSGRRPRGRTHGPRVFRQIHTPARDPYSPRPAPRPSEGGRYRGRWQDTTAGLDAVFADGAPPRATKPSTTYATGTYRVCRSGSCH